MKRLLIIGLILLLITSVVGCGYTEQDLDEAYEAGYAEGYDAGAHDGYKLGYTEGKNAALAEFELAK